MLPLAKVGLIFCASLCCWCCVGAVAERLGWMGDAAISAESASYNFPGVDGVARVQAQFLDMIADGQGDDGAVSDITPTVWQLGAMQPSDASWGSAFPTMAYQVWMTTGSTAVIGKHLVALVKYIDSLASRLQHSGMVKNNLGHCTLPHSLLRCVGDITARPRNRWISLTRSCTALLFWSRWGLVSAEQRSERVHRSCVRSNIHPRHETRRKHGRGSRRDQDTR